VSSAIYFSNLLEDKNKRFKTNLTLSLILRVNLPLRGYSIWSASLIAPHIKEDFTTTRGMSTSQPRYSDGSTQKTHSRWSSGELEDAFRSTQKPAVLDYEELGGLSDISRKYSRTTRAVVELVGIEGNYPSSTQAGLLSSYLTRMSM
jgi:hypothetical protein